MAKHKLFLILIFFLILSAFIYYKLFYHSAPVFTPITTSTITKIDALPNSHLIKTTFIPQAPEKNWSEPWQDSCEEAALLTVYYYYQQQNPRLESMLFDYQKIFDFESQQNWTHDINVSQMATLSAKLWDYQPIIIDNPTLDDFRKYLLQDIPIIIPSNGKTLFKENTHFKNGGPWYHNLVVLGYNDDKKQFTVHDVGTQFGSYFHYSYPTLLNSIHDFPPSLKKEDIDSGMPRVLILLK